jgi:hypothetical protein
MKTFFIHGDRSGIRFSTAARGYEIKKLNINLISSTEAPVAPASASKASQCQYLIYSRRDDRCTFVDARDHGVGCCQGRCDGYADKI